MRFNFLPNFFHKKGIITYFLIPILLIIGCLVIYKSIYTNPRNWYDHYLYLAKSLIQGRVDIPDLPQFYHDKLEINGKNYIPFPPGASFLLLPFILVNNSITQQQVSIIIGALDVALIYFLLLKFTSVKKALFLSVFLGFGTSFFWASVVGTTWYFAHIVAIFYLTISLLLHFSNKHFLSGIFFALAALTRMPLVVSGVFFLLELWPKKKGLVTFLFGASVFLPILLSYDWLRFGIFGETGYYKIYEQYINSSYPYTIVQLIFPNAPYFGYLDVRNIPLHLYTFLFMPPNINLYDGVLKEIVPSPFGMGILFTSPLLFIALKPKFQSIFERNLYISAIVSAIPSFLHYMQGWVQFGYRFVLDFIVFLMIILALKFKFSKLTIMLFLISILVNFWGVSWAIKLGW